MRLGTLGEPIDARGGSFSRGRSIYTEAFFIFLTNNLRRTAVLAFHAAFIARPPSFRTGGEFTPRVLACALQFTFADFQFAIVDH